MWVSVLEERGVILGLGDLEDVGIILGVRILRRSDCLVYDWVFSFDTETSHFF